MPETITVPGRGTANAPPDFIRLHLGAINHGKDPVVILGNVTQATRAMKDEANNQRIKSEDIQTSAFQVQERRVYNPETHEYQQEGFTATQNTSVTIRDLELADMIVGRLINAMGYAGEAELTLQGVSSGLDDPERLRLGGPRKGHPEPVEPGPHGGPHLKPRDLQTPGNPSSRSWSAPREERAQVGAIHHQGHLKQHEKHAGFLQQRRLDQPRDNPREQLDNRSVRTYHHRDDR